MPTEEIPVAQLVVAVAAKWTGDVMAVPVDGEDTVTVAKQGSADTRTQNKASFINFSFLRLLFFFMPYETRSRKTNLKWHQLRFNKSRHSVVHG